MKLSSFFATSLVTLAVAFAGPIGCAAEASDDAGDEQSSEDDLTAGPSKSKLLGDVIAIKVDDKIVGAKSKVGAILKAMDLGATDMPQVATAIPRCMFSHPISFYGANDKLLGSGGFMCGAQQTTGTATAYIYVGTKAYSVTANLGGVFKQMDKPLQASDMLYGITNFTVTKPGGGFNARGTGSEAETIKTLLGAVGDKVTAIDPNAPTPRCMPARVVTFYRGNKEAASITSMCSANTGMSTGTLIEADGDKVGTLSLNMTTLAKVESKLRWSR